MHKISTLYFKTKNGNAYIYDVNNNMFHNAPDFFDNSSQINLLCETKDIDAVKRHALEHGCTEKELKDYLCKVKYLKRFGYFSSILNESRNTSTINETMIHNNLCKTTQLVFEVTESCNLKCYYCGYGSLYNPVEGRHNTFLSFEKAKAIIDFLSNFWKKDKSRNKTITVSFYGGEPLLNFSFIKKVVEYMSQLKLFDLINFSITTNGLLLNKHIDFLVHHNFKIDISLDGDYDENKYRVDMNHNNRHNDVLNNIKNLIKKYPDYFKNKKDKSDTYKQLCITGIIPNFLRHLSYFIKPIDFADTWAMFNVISECETVYLNNTQHNRYIAKMTRQNIVSFVNNENNILDSVFAEYHTDDHIINDYYSIYDVTLCNRQHYIDSIFDFDKPEYMHYARYNEYTMPKMSSQNDDLCNVMDYPLVNLANDTVTLRNQEDWILLNFWSLSCGPCIVNLQNYKNEQDSLGYRILENEGIKILAIEHLSNNMKLIFDVANRTNCLDIIYSAKNIGTKIRIPSLGYYYLISPDKKIAGKFWMLDDYKEVLKAKKEYEMNIKH